MFFLLAAIQTKPGDSRKAFREMNCASAFHEERRNFLRLYSQCESKLIENIYPLKTVFLLHQVQIVRMQMPSLEGTRRTRVCTDFSCPVGCVFTCYTCTKDTSNFRFLFPFFITFIFFRNHRDPSVERINQNTVSLSNRVEPECADCRLCSAETADRQI